MILHHHSRLPARVTRVTTAHGALITPTFMPVGTRAGVNCIRPDELVETGSQIILGGNTYHMLVAPGMEMIRQAGGMHRFMAWPGPMLTDSGGFQVYSLSNREKLCEIDETGAHFRHPVTGESIHMTPQVSIETQKIIGADIIMAFDQCTPDNASRELVLTAMARTEHWLKESLETHLAHPHNHYGDKQALFGIIQGGLFKDLREQCTEMMLSMPVDGYAIGGADIGFNMSATSEILDWVCPHLPDDRTRYTMGVGLHPQDLIDVVAMGVDIFDCVAPTRNARHGSLYCGTLIDTGDWLRFESEFSNACLAIKKAQYSQDESPIMPGCECYTCKHYSRSVLHYLYKNHTVAFASLATMHNIHVLQQVCKAMQDKIISESSR